MSIDLKKELGGNSLGGQWLVGRTENLPVQPGKGVFQYNNMTLVTRNSQNTLLASDYPDFYNLSNGFYNDYFYYARYTTGLTAPIYAESHGTTVIAVGASGAISRSTDTGVTWSSIASGVSAALKVVHYNTTNTKWYIPYATNKCLISSDDGLTWVDTTCTGLTWDNTSSYYTMRMESIGSTTVFSNGLNTYKTTNGSAWTVVTGPGKLTVGNGWFVVLHSDATAHASQDGTTWSGVNGGVPFLSYAGYSSAASQSYGIVYTDTRWIVATTAYDDFAWNYTSTTPRASQAPTNSIATPAWSINYYAYSSSSSPVSTWNYFRQDYPAGTSTGWTTNGGSAFYFQEIRSNGFYVGLFGTFGENWGFTSGYGYSTGLVSAAGSFETWHLANVAQTALSSGPTTTYLNAGVSLATLDLTGIGYMGNPQSVGVTRGNLVWGAGNAFLTLSGSGTAPSRVLPVYTNVYGGEGVACTRIK